jgi:hypothetical protein
MVLEPGVLTYYGDQTAFQIRADQVMDIQPVGKYSRFGSKAPKHALTWRETPQSPERSFILEWCDVMSWEQSLRMRTEASEILRSWAGTRPSCGTPVQRFGPPSFPATAVGTAMEVADPVGTIGCGRTMAALVLSILALAALILFTHGILPGVHGRPYLFYVLSVILGLCVFRVLVRSFREPGEPKQ